MQRRGYSSASGSQQLQHASTGSNSQHASTGSSSQHASTGSSSQHASTGGSSQQSGGRAPASSVVSLIPLDPPTPGHRHIYLVSQCYAARRSHWFLWIPSLQMPRIGRIIHVLGSPQEGFDLQIKDNHDMSVSKQYNQFVHLGEVLDRLVTDGYTPRIGPPLPRADGDLRDDYDIAASALELPRRDWRRPPEPLTDPVWISPHPRFERCQEWTRRLIADLVKDRKLPQNAIELMDTAISYTDERGFRFAYNLFAPPWGT